MLNRYFLYSGGFHILIAAILMFAVGPAFNKKPLATYTIDFLGQNFQAPVSGGETPAPPAAQPAPPAESPKETPPAPAVQTPPAPNPKAYAAKQEITKKPLPVLPKKIVLGTPSILNNDDKKPAAQPAPATTSAKDTGTGGPEGIRTDFPNFPYPWYITQVRNSLWEQWEKRKPRRVVLNTLVSFAIKSDGSISGVKVSKSSGSDGYDYAAKSSVEGAAPFPPLPKDFGKPELTVTVEFRDEGN
ncbi:MAG: TonB family protein [Elusimicrobia bacterium]|nr:TonB family protein [Elusimicrobiota bacterium]